MKAEAILWNLCHIPSLLHSPNKLLQEVHSAVLGTGFHFSKFKEFSQSFLLKKKIEFLAGPNFSHLLWLVITRYTGTHSQNTVCDDLRINVIFSKISVELSQKGWQCFSHQPLYLHYSRRGISPHTIQGRRFQPKQMKPASSILFHFDWVNKL